MTKRVEPKAIAPTPLHAAVYNRDIEAVRQNLLLLDVNGKDSDGDTPIHVAAKFGTVEIIDLLLAKGADLRLANHKSFTPLEKAVHREPGKKAFSEKEKSEQIARVEKLLDAGALSELAASGKSLAYPLIVAAESGDLDMMKLLHKHGALVTGNRHGKTALGHAVTNMNMDMIEWLVAQGADINDDTDGKSPLARMVSEAMNASSNKKKKMTFNDTLDEMARFTIIEWLVKNGATTDFKLWEENTIYHWLADNRLQNRSAQLAEHVFAKNQTIDILNSRGWRPLHTAALAGNILMIEWLLSKGADINAPTRDHFKKSPLSRAYKSKSAMKLFIDRGAKMDDKALLSAAYQGYLDIVINMLDKGANPNAAEDINGDRIMHNLAEGFAAGKIKSDVLIGYLNQLAERGVDIDQKNEDGDTALQDITKTSYIGPDSKSGKRYRELVFLLADNGADLNVRNSKTGLTVLGYCIKKKKACGIRKELLEIGAQE